MSAAPARTRDVVVRALRNTLLWIVVLGAIATGLVLLARGEPGYVLVGFRDVSIETNVWVAGVAVLLLYGVLRILLGSYRALVGEQSWWRRRMRARARRRTFDGLLALEAGEHESARTQLLAALPLADAPAVNLLASARAARAMGDTAQATRYLEQAEAHLSPQQPVAALLRAELTGPDDARVAALRELRARAPRHEGVLRALLRALESARDWPGLRALMPDARKALASSPTDVADLEKRMFRGVVGSATTVDTVQDAWAELSKPARADTACALAYALALHRLGADHVAEPATREALNAQWDSALVTLYGALRADVPAQIRTVEGWLGQRAEDAVLLRTLGRLHAAAGEWLAARNALDAAHRAYARLPEAQRGVPALRCALELAEAQLRLGEVDPAIELLQQQRV